MYVILLQHYMAFLPTLGGQKPELLYLPTYSKYLLSIEIQKPLTASTKPLVFTKMGENSPKIGTISNY